MQIEQLKSSISTPILLISVFSFCSCENESIESSTFIITESDSLLDLEVMPVLDLVFWMRKFVSILTFFPPEQEDDEVEDELTGDVHILEASLFN